MEELISYQNNLISQVPGEWYRYLFPKMSNLNLSYAQIRDTGKSYLALDRIE